MKFTPGQSGNLSGRPKNTKSVPVLARQHGNRIVEVLADIMNNDSTDPQARVDAANALFQIGLHKQGGSNGQN